MGSIIPPPYCYPRSRKSQLWGRQLYEDTKQIAKLQGTDSRTAGTNMLIGYRLDQYHIQLFNAHHTELWQIEMWEQNWVSLQKTHNTQTSRRNSMKMTRKLENKLIATAMWKNIMKLERETTWVWRKNVLKKLRRKCALNHHRWTPPSQEMITPWWDHGAQGRGLCFVCYGNSLVGA